MGRPKKLIDERALKEIERMASLGMSQPDICLVLGISESTLLRRKKDQVGVLHALKKGRAEGLQKVAGALMKAAMSGSVAAGIFILKAQYGWKETSRTELTGAKGRAIKHEHQNIRDLSENQLEEIAGLPVATNEALKNRLEN